jgi:PRTRC genetic system ParB family protein
LVRPHPTKEGFYEVAGGHSRRELGVEAGLTRFPVKSRAMTDDEMEEFAILDNTQRQDMNPIDEGLAAKALLRRNGGDNEEVMRILGWDKKKLSSRIQLSYACDEIAEALSEETIKLGHVELLCGLRPEAQIGGLNVILNNKLNVEQTRKRIEARAMILEKAIFDKTECQTCPSNSTPQTSMFETAYDKGKCLNGACFKAKSEAAVEAKKVELSESYHIIATTGEIAEGTTTALTATGAKGLGQAQIDACSMCTKKGALISDKIDSYGQVTENVCFDMPCNDNKVKVYQDSLKAINSEGESKAKVAKASKDKTKAVDSKEKVKSEAPKPTVASIPKSIVASNHNIHRLTASHFIGNSSLYAKALALIAVIADASIKTEDAKKIGLPVEGLTLSMTADGRKILLEKFIALDETALDRFTQMAVCLSIEKSTSGYSQPDKPETDVYGAAAMFTIKTNTLGLEDHFLMNLEYLDSHTKPVIKLILEDAKFHTAYEMVNKEGSFEKLINKKKDVLLKEVFDFKFNWKGYIPPTMRIN